MASTGKKIVVGGAALAIAAIVFASIIAGGAKPTGAVIEPTGDAPATTTANGNVQEVKLSFKNYEYILEPSTLQKGVPVRMEVDLDSVYGCMRSIVISAFNVHEYVSEGDNIIEFTPDKAGTFGIACSMNMGRGQFTVLEADGTKSDFVEETTAEPAPAGSCGASGGGCGCGGAI